MASEPKAPKPEKPKTDKAPAAEAGGNSTPRTADQDHDQPAADAAAAADQAAAPAAGSVAEPAATTNVDGNAEVDPALGAQFAAAAVAVSHELGTSASIPARPFLVSIDANLGNVTAGSLAEGRQPDGELTKVVIVKSKSERGRRRAGYAFTREETRIPLADLSDDQMVALVADAELIVETIDEVTAG